MTPKENSPTNPPQRDLDRCNVKGFELLRELSLNLHWSWDHAGDILWKELNPELWDLTHNPWAVLQSSSREKLEHLLSDPAYENLARELVESNRKMQTAPSWFSEHHGNAPIKCIAYFSMEFMLAEALPIYSGGLGNVAGDQLKAASDLGVPVYGVGLLYQQGYFRQILDNHGAQQALYPYNDPGQLPITPLRKSNGEWLRLEIMLPGHSIWVRTWQVQVGRIKLLLLDSNDMANYPAYRGITSELYGGDNELRLRQEIILGIGGWRMLEALNLSPTVCHLNEGHAAFVVLERAYSFMKQHKVSFDIALKITRAGNLFTTHTAVPAGFDRFSAELINKYLSFFVKNHLQISMKELLALGRENPDNENELFNMAYLAMRGCAFANAVSALHEDVSRSLFAPIFPRYPDEEIPIGHVTNGVHVPSWDSVNSDKIWSQTCGKKRWLSDTNELKEHIYNTSDKDLWEMRTKNRTELVKFSRKRLALQHAVSGLSSDEIMQCAMILNPNILTFGFARRFATYKRSNLLLHNPDRLLAILNNKARPIQLLLSGKAHPADRGGQALIQQWSNFIKRPDVKPHVVFLSDYNMLLSEKLVQGVDVWINTPLRPWEACGTSGMKVLSNGGLNLSIPDGWWAEAYNPSVGWAIGNGEDEGLNENQRDARDANILYTLLENEIIPMFYNRNEEGIPKAWIDKMRASMSELTPVYSSNRCVREYTEKYYLPAAELYEQRQNNHAIVFSQQDFEKKWQKLHFGSVNVETLHNAYRFSVELSLHDLPVEALTVELFANNDVDKKPLRYTMHREKLVSSEDNTFLYSVEIPMIYPETYYTPRALPITAEQKVTSLECPLVLWQR